MCGRVISIRVDMTFSKAEGDRRESCGRPLLIGLEKNNDHQQQQ